jgi:hypothetical protein
VFVCTVYHKNKSKKLGLLAVDTLSGEACAVSAVSYWSATLRPAHLPVKTGKI